MHILMISAENDALPGGKVGGLGDVIRDIPIALTRQGQQVSVISPGYGLLADNDRAALISQFDVCFAGRIENVSCFSVESPSLKNPGVRHFVLEHWLFAAGGKGSIYTMDHYGPFATDAHKFALYSVAVCEALAKKIIPEFDILHCHDWHSSLVLILRQFDPAYQFLQKKHAVFSIHNLSIQGIRPFAGDDSSLTGWFPDLKYSAELIRDPINTDCVNLMRAGINLADKVHAVSPTYAQEILGHSDWEQANIGGEGLEEDLNRANDQKKLVGILNGCDYSNVSAKTEKKQLYKLIENCLNQWTTPPKKTPDQNNELFFNSLSPSYLYAFKRLNQWKNLRQAKQPILISIGRINSQKMGLMLECANDHSVMDEVLARIKPGCFILLGSGDREYDLFFTEVMSRHDNFLYLCGFSNELASALYNFGDLFFMPSIYEPCGISQMLAMRGGMPCLVNEAGGLKDTVIPGKNGFVFDGAGRQEKVDNLLATTSAALETFRGNEDQWQQLVEGAKHSRFSWDDSAKHYCELLYLFKTESIKATQESKSPATKPAKSKISVTK